MKKTRNAFQRPLLVGEFFELGQAESASPFLSPQGRRLAVHLPLKSALAAAIFLIAAFASLLHPPLWPFTWVLLVAVYVLAGIPSLISALEDLSNWIINIDVLMTLAAFASVGIGSPFEGALLLVLFELSGTMEEAVSARAKGTLSALHRLVPTRAAVIMPGGKIIERALAEVAVGDTILVRAGQVVPLDGVVIEGTASLNLVHLTGENKPALKKAGDEVAAGALNLDGTLTLHVNQPSSNSTLARIIQLVTDAQEAKPQLQRWFDRFSQRYATGIIAAAALFALLLPYALEIPYLGSEGSIYRALAFLVAASPCALILAIPIAYLSAISACARSGILIKGGIALEALATCRAIAFDKTGTLTTGALYCLGVEQLSPSGDIQTAVCAAYALERNAVHPIANAISSYAEKKGCNTIPIESFKAIPGYGLSGIVKGKSKDLKAFIGLPEYVSNEIPPSLSATFTQTVAKYQREGEVLAALALGEELYLFRFQDELRANLKPMLQRLRDKYHLNLLMLTGDHGASAQRVASALGLDTVYADLRPADKLNHVAQLAKNQGLAMIGDGINDAPALARATVGISMGQVGSSVAIDAADIVLLQDSIEKLDWLIDKAHVTASIVKQNLLVAIGAIAIAAMPALAGLVPLWLAVTLHEGGTVLVGLNALRLLRR